MMQSNCDEDVISHNGMKLKNDATSIKIIMIMAAGLVSMIQIGQAQSDNTIMNPIIMHIHPQLEMMMDNKPMTVPSQIGIDPSLWKDHSLDKYGMQAMPEMDMKGMAPLHTHDDSGILHVESSVNRDYTLGEFLRTWGLNLDGNMIKVTVNDKPIEDFRNHVLKDGEQIRLDVKQR
ncbi:MAG: hypothetical protein ACRD5J_13560 [Nitrososphaeraceae archaeon]